MALNDFSEALRDAERTAVLSGVPAAKAAAILIKAEAELIQAMAESKRAEKQLLLDLREKGASQVAKEHRRSRRWVYNQRAKALNKLCTFGM